MNSENPYAIWLYTILASFAGALTALASRPFVNMRASEIALSLVIGGSFAIFVGPWVVTMIFGQAPVDTKIVGAVYYLMASGSNVLIPIAIRRIGGAIGAEPTP